MMSSAQLSEMDKRVFVYCPSGTYYYNGDCIQYSSWYWWGRWVFAAIVIIFLAVLLLLWARLSSRRRRRRGEQPFYGTGWMAPAHKYGTYQHDMHTYQPPPPQYSTTPMGNQYTGQTFNSNEGYYGSHYEGVQAPQNTYYPPQQRGGEPAYEAPPGPPPGK